MPTKPHGSAASQQDAIAALTADHRKVKGLFKQFEQAKEERGRQGATEKTISLLRSAMNSKSIQRLRRRFFILLSASRLTTTI